MFGEKFLKITEPEQHSRFKIQCLINHKAIPNTSLPDSGINSKHGIFKETVLFPEDFISLTNYDDTTPSFSKNDIKFSALDIIKMLENNGYYSADEKNQADNQSNSKDSDLKNSAYCLIAVLKDLLLDPEINAYHFKTDSTNTTNQPTQAGLAEYVNSLSIKGLKTRNINGIFSKANGLLSDAKKN